jgi:hypothetical protein
MGWLLFLGGSLISGWWLVTRLPFKRQPWAVQYALTIIFGMIGGSWLSLLFSVLYHSSTLGVWTATAVLFVPLIFLWREKRVPPVPQWGVGMIALLAVFVVMYLYTLHAPRLNPGGGLSAHGYTWSDVALHMSIASFFAHQPFPTLEFPLLPNTALTYPFLFDWQASVLLRLGASWFSAIAVPATMTALAAWTLSMALIRRLLGSWRVGVWHLLLFLGLGTAGGAIPLVRDLRAGAFTWFTDYSNPWPDALTLANPLTSHFFPQRSFLLGFAGVMAGLYLLRMVWEEQHWKVLPSLGLFIGLLPLTHIHSMAVVAGWFMGVSLILFLKVPSARRSILWGLTLLGITAAPQMWWQLSHIPAEFGYRYSVSMWDSHSSVMLFWFRQLGVTLVLMVAGLLGWKRYGRDVFLIVGFVGAAIILTVGNLYITQPNPFDNLKYLLYGFWILLIPAAWAVDWLWQRMRWRWAVPLLILASIFVGGTALIRDLRDETNYEVFSSDQIATADDLESLIPVDARVATAERPNNLVAGLMGRRILSGYDGWLWSYGMDYRPAHNAQKEIIAGRDNGTLTTQFQVDYILVSSWDSDQGVSIERLQGIYPQIWNGGSWYLFRAQPFTSRVVPRSGE